MTAKLNNKSIMVILAVLTTVVFAMSSQQLFGNDDPNAKSPKAAKEQAKEQGEVRDGIKDRAEKLGKELGLTEQQKKDAMPILENETKDLLSVMTNKSLTKEQMLEKINVIHQTTKEQLSKVLTLEQQKKYAEMNTDTNQDSQKFTERHIERISEKLNLTGQQKKDITPIIKNEMKVSLPIMTNKSLTKEQKMEKINAIHQATKGQLSRILTPEQLKKYAEMNTDTRDDSQKFAERHIDRMSEKLNLNRQQKKDIAPIIESEMKEVRAITNNESLTREQKWEKINAIHQATKERLSKILTPEQQRKYADEMEHQAPERNAEHSGEGHNNSQQKPVDSNSK